MKVKVNDAELELKAGTSAIDAIFAAGYDVPYFCSQEYMSPIGACRMCLAKIGAPRKDRDSGEWIIDEQTGEPKIFFFPNLMASCTTAIMEGMVIDTLSKEVKDAQNGMIEFTLVNHPLDCPTCDKGGACELQDRAYEYGAGQSRFVFDKRHQEKHHALSELITLDRERCIHCKRCVRYFEEIPGDEVLDFIERGVHSYIGTLEDGLPSNFTGNITDFCPVGALLDSTSRFRGRNWEYDHTRSSCLDCAVGCAITIDARTGRIERIKAARNTQVNNDWICDGGRFGHEYVDADERLKTPLIRRDGKLTPSTWEEAAAFINDKLADLGAKETGIILRADATLEEGVAAKALAAQLETGQLDHFPRLAASVIPQGVRATLNDVATSDAILVLGDVSEEAPIVDLRIKEALKGVTPPELMPHGVPLADLRLKERMPRQREILTVASPYRCDLMKHAGSTLTYPAGTEVELLASLLQAANGEGEISEEAAMRLGSSPEQLNDLLKRLSGAKNPVIIYGAFVLAASEASNAVQALAKAVGAKLLAIGPMANSYGLEALAVLPSHARYSVQEMLRGSAKALIVSGLDVAKDAEAAKALKELELLVVHDSFANATTELAHVVLPAKTAYEKEGTVVNLEGRYLPLKPAPVENGQSEDFCGLVKFLGETMGTRLEGRSVRSARRLLKKRLQLDLSELSEEGYLSPAKAKAASKFKLKESYELEGNLLLTPSMIRHEQLSRNAHLHAVYGDAALRLNPADAVAQDLNDGDVVAFELQGIERQAVIKRSEAVPVGLMLLPALPEQPAALLWLEPTKLIKAAVAEVLA